VSDLKCLESSAKSLASWIRATTILIDGIVQHWVLRDYQWIMPDDLSKLLRADLEDAEHVCRYISYFDAIAIESTIPQTISFEEKASKYRYQPAGKDKYPPHLDVIPTKDETPLWQIFNAIGLLDAASLLPKIVPKTFIGRIASEIQSTLLDVIDGEPQNGPAIADVEKRNKYDRQSGTDIERGANIGSDYDDWYSDARFAQQQFTGTNPTTLTTVSPKLLDEFKAAATAQDLKAVVSLLDSAGKDLYVQDCSYFREAAGLQPDDVMISEDPIGNRFGCAAVSLFHLNPDGKLHPLAVCVDYKVDMKNSVVIFNKRLHPSDFTSQEKEDWPWRYAKTCAQVSDWARHEIAIHLVDTHLVCTFQGKPALALIAQRDV